MDYPQLVQAIVDYTANYEQSFINNLPIFITQAEDRVYQSVEFPALRKTAYSTCTVGSKYLAAPVDFLASFSLAIKRAENYEVLLDKDVNWLTEAFQNDLVMGTPAYYALFDANTFILGPTPDAAYYIECNYFYKPQSIVTAGTSWLGDNMPSVLLYGSLVEAYGYMKGEPDIMANYKERYEAALGNLRNLGEGRNRLDAYRSGQTRVREKA
jgi:hypothetical protein